MGSLIASRLRVMSMRKRLTEIRDSIRRISAGTAYLISILEQRR